MMVPILPYVLFNGSVNFFSVEGNFLYRLILLFVIVVFWPRQSELSSKVFVIVEAALWLTLDHCYNPALPIK